MKASLEQTTLVQCLFSAREFRSLQPAVLRSIITHDDVFLLTTPMSESGSATTAATERLALLDYLISQTKRELFAEAQIRRKYAADSREPVTTAYTFDVSKLSSNAAAIAIQLIQQHYQAMEESQKQDFKRYFNQHLDHERSQNLQHEQSIYEAMLSFEFHLPELSTDDETGAAAPADGDQISIITESETYREVCQLNRALALLKATESTLCKHLDTRPKVNLGRMRIFGFGGSTKQKLLTQLHALQTRCKHTIGIAFNHDGMNNSAQSILRSRQVAQTTKQIKEELANPGRHRVNDTGDSLYHEAQTLCQVISTRLAKSHSHSSQDLEAGAQAAKPQKPRARTMTEHYISFTELAARQKQANSAGGGSRELTAEPFENHKLTLEILEPYQMDILVKHLSNTFNTLDQSVDLIRYLLRRSQCDYLIQMMRVPTTEDSESEHYDPYALIIWSLTAHMKKAFFDCSNFNVVLQDPETKVTFDRTQIAEHWQHFMHALVIVNLAENSNSDEDMNPQTSFADGFANTCVKQIINSFDAKTEVDAIAIKAKMDTIKMLFNHLLTQTITDVTASPYRTPATAVGVDRDFVAQQPLQDCLNSAAFQADLALYNLTFLTGKLKQHITGRKQFKLSRALGSGKEQLFVEANSVIEKLKSILKSCNTDIALISQAHELCYDIGTSLEGSIVLTKPEKQEVSKRTPEQPARTRSYSADDANDEADDNVARALFLSPFGDAL